MEEINLPVTMQPRPVKSLMLLPVMQNFAGGSPPPMRVCPSSSCPTVPLWPPDAVSPKQQVELLHGNGLELTRLARVSAKIAMIFILNIDELGSQRVRGKEYIAASK